MRRDGPTEREAVALRHMVGAARKGVEFARGRTREDLDSDEMLALALVRLLEIVGEAARRISIETRSLAPAIPWQQIVGTRDRLIHGYDEVDLDVVWTIVSRELPGLIDELSRLLGELDG